MTNNTLLMLLMAIIIASATCHGRDILTPSVDVCKDTLTVEIVNRQSISSIEPKVSENAAALDSLDKWLTSQDKGQITSIIISAGASPEGTLTGNANLAQKRTANIRSYISAKYMFDDSLFICKDEGIRWEELRDVMLKSDKSYAKAVVDIINNMPEVVYAANGAWLDSRLKRLKNLNGGAVYYDLLADVFPSLRTTRVSVVYSIPAPPPPVVEVFIRPEPVCEPEPVEAECDTVAEVVTELVEEVIAEPCSLKKEHTRYVVIKNNFVYDAALVANIGIEFAGEGHFSFNLPITFSPYDIRPGLKIRTLTLQPDFRWWFREGLEGAFTSLYGNFGWYNVALGGKTRYQNSDSWKDPLYGGGLGAGYRWRLGSEGRLGLELEAGAGYAYLPSNHYYNVPNGAYFDSSIRNYFGLTKLGFNISYIIVSKHIN